MIDSSKVLVATPAIDGKVECSYAGGLASCASAHLFGNMVFLAAVSHIGLARNMLARGFIQSHFEWLVFIDADIGFAESDFRLLMDYPPRDGFIRENSAEENPEGTTLTNDGHALIVTAEYSRKVETLDTARFGLGFTRIHRDVFNTLSNHLMDDGQAMVQQFLYKGELIPDFFPSGPIEANNWRGEDTGFFLLCKLAGITPRIEQRTRLHHFGKKDYPYIPPAVGIAMQAQK
jgi:hypothetical protein